MDLNGNIYIKYVYALAACMFSTMVYATALVLMLGVGEGRHTPMCVSSSKLSFTDYPGLTFYNSSLYLALVFSEFSCCMEGGCVDCSFWRC